MKEHFQLNGSTGWIFSILIMIVIQSVSIGFWAGSVSKDVKYLQKDVTEMKQDMKEYHAKKIDKEENQTIH